MGKKWDTSLNDFFYLHSLLLGNVVPIHLACPESDGILFYLLDFFCSVQRAKVAYKLDKKSAINLKPFT